MVDIRLVRKSNYRMEYEQTQLEISTAIATRIATLRPGQPPGTPDTR